MKCPLTIATFIFFSIHLSLAQVRSIQSLSLEDRYDIKERQYLKGEAKLSVNTLVILEELNRAGMSAKDYDATQIKASYHSPIFPIDSEGRLICNIYLKDTIGMHTILNDFTFIELIGHKAKYKKIVAQVPLYHLSAIANHSKVAFIEPMLQAITQTGNVTSEGDAVLNAVAARALGFEGNGIRIGVISDGVHPTIENITALSQLENADTEFELTPTTNSLDGLVDHHSELAYEGPQLYIASNSNLPSCTNTAEGLAMLEIIHDLAPKADLVFASGKGCSQDVEDAIALLRVANCDIIVDDLLYTDQPYFQHKSGRSELIWNEINPFVNQENGIYVSSTGNYAAQQYVKEANFVEIDNQFYHAFSSGDYFLNFNIPSQEATTFTLQWNDNWDSPNVDLDLLIYNTTDLSNGPIQSSTNNNTSSLGKAIESLTVANIDTNSSLPLFVVIKTKSGSPIPTDLRLRLLWTGNGNSYTDNSAYLSQYSTVFGHPTFEEVITVGAVDHQTVSDLRPYSARGPVLNYEDLNLPPKIIEKPDLVATDGVSVSGAFNFDNPFFGTSAAAPHVAAIAALVKSTDTGLSNDEIKRVLFQTANASPYPNFSFNSNGKSQEVGYGLVNAALASTEATIACSDSRGLYGGVQITSNNPSKSFNFGVDLSLIENELLVGAESGRDENNDNVGSVHYFEFNDNKWEEKEKFFASNRSEFDKFGCALARDNNTIVVGAYGADPQGSLSGKAYVFEKNGSAWSEVQELQAITNQGPDGNSGDYFGYDVAIAGEFIAVSAYQDDDLGTKSGTVYIFKRNGNNWNFHTKLNASDGTSYDYYGRSMDMQEDRLIVGAYGTNKVYVYLYDGEFWLESSQILIPSGSISNNRFGYAVSLDDDRIAVGAPGTESYTGRVHLFDLINTTWEETQQIDAIDKATNDDFGEAVDLHNGMLVVGAIDGDGQATESGKAYLYRYNGNRWVEDKKIEPFDSEEDDNVGNAVAIHGNHILVASIAGDNPLSNSDYGAVYFYCFNCESWKDETRLFHEDLVMGDEFGEAVAIAGNIALVGAPHHDGPAGQSEQGAAFVYRFMDDQWQFVDKIYASDGAEGDAFGTAVDISDDYLLIGSEYGDDGNGTAYLYRLIGSNIVFQKKLVPNDPGDLDRFGKAVAIDGNYIIIGASGNSSGAAYVFTGSGSSWSQNQKVIPQSNTSYGSFGAAVAINGSDQIIAIGAPTTSITNATFVGEVYVFRHNGTEWFEEDCLGGGGDGARLGFAIDIDGQRIVAGAPYNYDNVEMLNNAGSVLIYDFDGSEWQSTKIRSSDIDGSDYFGYAVSTSNNTILVGSRSDSGQSIGSFYGGYGSAYLFQYNGSAWHQTKIIDTKSNSINDSQFNGNDVSIKDTVAIVGAPWKNSTGEMAGSAYIYKFNQTTGDIDADGVCDDIDNCPTVYNPTQEDYDQNGIADACENIPGLCVMTLLETSNYSNGDIFTKQAADLIIGTNTINSGAIIIYNAGNRIDLNPGFEVKQGATFETQHTGCSTNGN